MDIEDIKILISDYRKAEEVDNFDDFQEQHGDIDNVLDTLVDFIEDEILKRS